MAKLLAPTTKPQVSGYKFLVRRAEHGLIFGDARMIHDPLARMRRSVALGAIACVIFAVGAGALAMMKPRADPGDAPIVRAASGGLYVRVDDVYHPALNLTSARLIAGQPADPANVADEVMAYKTFGTPVGIPGAPGTIVDDKNTSGVWAACAAGTSDTHVVEGLESPPQLGPGEFIVARDVHADSSSTTKDYVITSEGRRLLPPEGSTRGTSVRRRLGISPDVELWEPPAQVLEIIPELAPMESLTISGELTLVTAGEETWFDDGEGLAPVTDFQAGIVEELGAHLRTVRKEELSGRPLSSEEIPLPKEKGTLVSLDGATVCVTQQARVGDSGPTPPSTPPGEQNVVTDPPVVGVLPKNRQLPVGLALSGDSVATQFSATRLGGMPVNVGDGVVLVGETGTYFPVPAESVAALGVEKASPAPWPVVRLLPRGVALTATEAGVTQHGQ